MNFLLLASFLLLTTTSAASNGTISVLSATYGSSCTTPLSLTSEAAAYCKGLETCTYTICICGWDKNCTSNSPPCVPDPDTGCAKDFRVTWSCTEDPTVRSAYLPAEADKSSAILTCGPPPPVFTPRDITVAAFVYDPWTPEPAVFGSHGVNWTEWNLVRNAIPRFPGHLQPKQPLWGELDTGLPATWDKLNTAALAAGIEVYLWDWYWWSDAPTNPLLVKGLENGFLKSPTSSKMKWAVMWANQDWIQLFPAQRKAPNPPIFHGDTNATVFEALSNYWIDKYFHLKNYFQVEGCPLVSIYQINVLVDSLGGMGPATTSMAAFRARAAAAGFPCVHVQAMGFGVRRLPLPLAGSMAALGVNSVTDYCPQHYSPMEGFPLVDYPSYSSNYISSYGALAAQVAPVPYIPNFGVAWDPSPRTIASDDYDGWGYPSTPVLQPTLPEFRTAIAAAAASIAAKCTEAWCMMSVYAYTEFSEGGSLWPTVVDGTGRLDAFTAVFGNRSGA